MHLTLFNNDALCQGYHAEQDNYLARPQMRDNSVAVSYMQHLSLDMKLHEWCMVISGSHNTIVNHTGPGF